MHHRETVNGYLSRIAKAAVVRKKTKSDIERSIKILSSRIEEYFGHEVIEPFTFGSYSRKTMLPRFMDSQSDVDVMVVFKNQDSTPQTYLNRLKRFTAGYYGRHEILQSHPTIMLELNHIKFDLVPALECGERSILIPAKTTSLDNWMETDPHVFKEQCIEKNQIHEQQILPFVRLMKYWNAVYGRPFSSFELEEAIIETGYRSLLSRWFGNKWSLFSYAHRFAEAYEPSTNRQADALSQFRSALDKTNELGKNDNVAAAVQSLKHYLPLP